MQGSGSILTMVPVSGGLDVSRALPQLPPQRPAQQAQRARSPDPSGFAAGRAVLVRLGGSFREQTCGKGRMLLCTPWDGGGRGAVVCNYVE